MEAMVPGSILDKILSTPAGGTVLLSEAEISLVFHVLSGSAATGSREICGQDCALKIVSEQMGKVTS